MQPHLDHLVRRLREITNGLSEAASSSKRQAFRSSYARELAELRQSLDNPLYVSVFDTLRSACARPEVPLPASKFAQFQDIEQKLLRKYRVRNRIARELGKHYRKRRLIPDRAALDSVLSSPLAFGERVDQMVRTAVDKINASYPRRDKRRFKAEGLDELERVHLLLIGTIALLTNLYDEHRRRDDGLLIASSSIGQAFAGHAVAA
jgi:hypothetical protein